MLLCSKTVHLRLSRYVIRWQLPLQAKVIIWCHSAVERNLMALVQRLGSMLAILQLYKHLDIVTYFIGEKDRQNVLRLSRCVLCSCVHLHVYHAGVRAHPAVTGRVMGRASLWRSLGFRTSPSRLQCRWRGSSRGGGTLSFR